MQDDLSTFADSPAAPASQCFAVIPSDGGDLPLLTKGIYIGTGGDVTLAPAAGGDVTFRNVPSGAILDVRTRAVRATGTTASNIVGLA